MDRKRYDLNKTIYIGDGIFDYLVMKKVKYSICPSNSDMLCKKYSNFVTKRSGGDRAVSEACRHILKKFFKKNIEDISLKGKFSENGQLERFCNQKVLKNKIMNLLEKNGFILIKGALSRQTVYQIKDRLKKLKPKAYVPFTDIPWGFGNLLEDKVFSKILSNKKINKQLEKFFNTKNYTFNHLMVNNKALFLDHQSNGIKKFLM